jgi:hypothetical protein
MGCSTALYAQGFITAKEKQQLILVVNKSNQVINGQKRDRHKTYNETNVLLQAINVTISGMQKGQLSFVDLTTYESPPSSIPLSSPTFPFSAYAVGVVALAL